MKAITITKFGGPEVLKVAEVPEQVAAAIGPDSGKILLCRGWQKKMLRQPSGATDSGKSS